MKTKLTIALVGAAVLAVVAGSRWTTATPQNGKSQATDAGSLNQATKVVALKMTGMFCGGCEAAVQHAAREVGGVTAVKASADKGIAEVTYDPEKTSPAAIAKVITEKSGFKAEAPATPANKK